MPDKKKINNEIYLIWIDLEMTGLDTQNDHIIEIATIITNKELDFIKSDHYVFLTVKLILLI